MKIIIKISFFFIVTASLWCSVSNVENKFIYCLMSSSEKKSRISVDSLKINTKKKSATLAMLSSFIIPGSGQVYMGKWKRGLFYLGVESLAMFTKFSNNKKAKEKKVLYIDHANSHWDLARWIHDYYAWEPFSPPEWYSSSVNSWNEVRGVFVNNTDDECIDAVGYCYPDIWDHSHSVNFEWDGEVISSSSETKFKDIYKELCGISSDLELPYQYDSRECQNEIEDISNTLSLHEAKLILDHHFYEGIQKYSMYFAGWEDALLEAQISETNNNNTLIKSPLQISYQKNWSAYNEFSIKAERASSYMLINHFISMVDALIVSKISNKKYLMNLDIYPNLRNKLGLGGIRMTFNWK